MASVCETEMTKGIKNYSEKGEGPEVPMEIIAGICHHLGEVKRSIPGDVEDRRGMAIICELAANRAGVLDILRELSKK